jgi:DNA-binding transcriptional LysR family regulator
MAAAPPRLDPVDLEYFVTIVERGSLGAAAEALGVSQPSLSKCIQRLERALGVPLLVRSARGIAPTGLGEHLLHRSRHLLAELDATRRAMRELAGGGVGSVRLGLSPSLTTEFAPELCAIAHLQRPALTRG